MKDYILKTLIITLIFLLSGCAATYRPINPSSVIYNSFDFQDGIEFSYKYDVLREKKNKKYAKKEKGVKLIAMKITNHTKSVINVSRDLVFYSGQRQIIPMEPIAIKGAIKQNVPVHLFYLLLSFVNLTVTKSTPYHTETNVYPVGVIIGPSITITNMIIAGKANKKLLNELNEYNILSKDIQPGETVHGLMGVRRMGYDHIIVSRRM